MAWNFDGSTPIYLQIVISALLIIWEIIFLILSFDTDILAFIFRSSCWFCNVCCGGFILLILTID